MGLSSVLHGQRVYFDTNIFIYLLEGNSHLQGVLQELEESIAQAHIHIESSHLSYTEILPFHIIHNRPDAIAHVIQFLDNFEMHPISKEIAIYAGILRGETKMKTPDTLHVATAVHHNSDIFLTNDARIHVPKTIKRVLLSEYV